MIDVIDKRSRWEIEHEKNLEALQMCKDVKAQIQMNKLEIMKIAKGRNEKLICKICNEDMTFDYDLEKVEKHLNLCKLQNKVRNSYIG